MNILKYTNRREVVFFEKEKDLPENFIQASTRLNSIFLETGRFVEYVFNAAFVEPATSEDADMFQAMKDRSIHLIGN